MKPLLVALGVFLSLPTTSQAITWGVCGHPLSRNSPVWNSPETQMATLARYGLTTYRFDVLLTDDRPDAADRVEQLVQLADKYHITLHPILFVPFTYADNATDHGRYPATEAGLEQQGYQRTYPFVSKFAAKISDWELENELDLKPGMMNGIGRSSHDFDTPKGRQWAAVLRGMAKAIHDIRQSSGQPLRVVVDTTYIHFGFIEFLEQNGVPVDKLAYHYYYHEHDSPYKISAPGGGPVDLFAEMKRLGKPVIINEFNAAEIYAPKNEKKPYDDAKALTSLNKHIQFLLEQREANLEAVEFYELYNEPAKDEVESNFGLMSDATQPRAQMLLAAFTAGVTLTPDEKQVLISKGLLAP